MHQSKSLRYIAAVCACLFAAPAQAEPAVVVELFTSQGCNSCPPADAFLGDIADEPGVIALGFHVDYWDYLGWRDTFAQRAFSERQQSYVGMADRSAIKQRLKGRFTPEIVVQGTSSLIGHDRLGVAASVVAHAKQPAVASLSLTRSGEEIAVVYEARAAESVALMLARVLPVAQVVIERGENAGKTLTYHRVVTELVKLADLPGDGAHSVTVSVDGPVVVFAQAGPGGPILAASEID
ncbi:MAG: DUF1223 domain-containing protein [Pseudomonadota bacterium]